MIPILDGNRGQIKYLIKVVLLGFWMFFYFFTFFLLDMRKLPIGVPLVGNGMANNKTTSFCTEILICHIKLFYEGLYFVRCHDLIFSFSNFQKGVMEYFGENNS